MPKYMRYNLTSEQVDALLWLISGLDLENLEQNDAVKSYRNLPQGCGKILSNLYMDEHFGITEKELLRELGYGDGK